FCGDAARAETLTMTASHRPIATVMAAAGPRVRLKRPICPPSLTTVHECIERTECPTWTLSRTRIAKRMPGQIRRCQVVATRNRSEIDGFPSPAPRRIQRRRKDIHPLRLREHA